MEAEEEEEFSCCCGYGDSTKNDVPNVLVLREGVHNKGWYQGIKSLQKGERSSFTVPEMHAYGELGEPPRIPPKATLLFEMELLSLETPLNTRDISITRDFEEASSKASSVQNSEAQRDQSSRKITFNYVAVLRVTMDTVSRDQLVADKLSLEEEEDPHSDKLVAGKLSFITQRPD